MGRDMALFTADLNFLVQKSIIKFIDMVHDFLKPHKQVL